MSDIVQLKILSDDYIKSKDIIPLMHLSRHAEILLQDRYLLPGEAPAGMFERVARAIQPDKARDVLYIMKNRYFLPNSPTLMNAGTPLGQLSACFVLPVEDSLEGIFTTLTRMVLIHQSGGGTGFSFSHIRPKGDDVSGTGGVASGPLSFIRVFDAATDAVKQGGRRRGANMGVLASSHPDIMEFINSKRSGGFKNFNLSVAFDSSYFQALMSGDPYELSNPRNGEVTGTVDPRELWHAISRAAWESGDPGMLFLDEINRTNTVPGLDSFEATNPCGEQPLFNFESCNLGSINLSRCVKNGEIDWELLRYLVRSGVEFLDAVIDINRFPISKIREQTLLTRKIGLGVMGLAELFILLEVPYESHEALVTADRLMEFIQKEARETSHELGEWKGSFPSIDKSVFSTEMRNATVTTIAPTGSLHIIAETSSGIEPLFAVAYRRTISGKTIEVINPLFSEVIKSRRVPEDLLRKAYRTGSIQHLPLPDDIKDLFRIASEISPEHHVQMQATVQKHVDNAVSKTVNIPHEATVEDVSRIFSLARSLSCKGITIYRYKSKPEQVLTQGCEVCTVE
jgi:ribonucleoside-diphosphate reductase alpha chain